MLFLFTFNTFSSKKITFNHRLPSLSYRLKGLILNGYNKYRHQTNQKDSYLSEPEDLYEDDKFILPRAPFNTPETLSSTDSSPSVSPRHDYIPSFSILL